MELKLCFFKIYLSNSFLAYFLDDFIMVLTEKPIEQIQSLVQRKNEVKVNAPIR